MNSFTTRLRDPRFVVPPGMFLAAQGITSGPLWDRVVTNIISLDGRRAPSAAPTGVQGLHTQSHREAAHDGRTRSSTRCSTRCAERGHCDVVADIARHYPIPIICTLLGAPASDWEQFATWTDEFFKAFSWNAADEVSAILAALGRAGRVCRPDGRRPAPQSHRRSDLRPDPRRRRRRPAQPRGAAHAGGRTADGRHRHHPESAGRFGLRAHRPSRPVDAVDRASRTRRASPSKRRCAIHPSRSARSAQ